MMKNPNSRGGAGVSQVTSTATLASSGDATDAPFTPLKTDLRYRWCPLSNSVQPLRLRKGRIVHG